MGDKKKKARAKAKSKPKAEKELRLTQLESIELDLTERDEELALTKVGLAQEKLTNLTMQFNVQKLQLKQQIETAKLKYEQCVRIRNGRLAEIEHRLMKIDPKFSFKDYLEKDDGLLVLREDVIAAEDPTAGG